MSKVTMFFDSDVNDEFSKLLLTLVRQGDVNALETQLSTASHPEIYLNQLYYQSHKQKCTLLMIACLNEFEDIIQLFLKYSGLDLEVLNDIELSEKDDSLWMYQNVTVLWASAAINNYKIVKLLVKHGAHINHTTKTNSTAFRCACWNGNIALACFLSRSGANVNIAKVHNETNLIISVYNEDLNMTIYLVDVLGCNVNESMDDGRSPLYFAVERGSIKLVVYLLSRGARNFRSDYNKLSPLLLAAEKKRLDLIDLISPRCSLVEQIEALELLGSVYVCPEFGLHNFQKSFDYFRRALQLRSEHNIPKSLRSSLADVLDNRQECGTTDELENIRLNHDHIHTEALLIRERVLGPAHAKYRHSLRYYGASLADSAQHEKGIRYWLYELQLRQQYAICISDKDFRQWASIFSDMLITSPSIPVDAWQIVVKEIMKQLEYNTTSFDYNLETLLFLITIVGQILSKTVISIDDRKIYYELIHSIVRQQYVTQAYGSSLLHLSLTGKTIANNYSIDSICKYPCLHTARILLQCGADVNAPDSIRDTPLHVYVAQSDIVDNTIIQYLYNAGAHLDYANALGEIPFDITENSNIKQFLKTRAHRSLKCICATLIQRNGIPFHEVITSSLANFVEKH